MPDLKDKNKGDGDDAATDEAKSAEAVKKDAKKGAIETRCRLVASLTDVPRGQVLDVRPLYDNLYRLNFRMARDADARGFDTLVSGRIVRSYRVKLVRRSDGHSLEKIDVNE